MNFDPHTIITGLLAVVILIDISYLAITKQQVPELLSNLAFTVFGYYFGRRAGDKHNEPH